MGVEEDKKLLRETALAERRAFDEGTCAERSAALCARLQALLEERMGAMAASSADGAATKGARATTAESDDAKTNAPNGKSRFAGRTVALYQAMRGEANLDELAAWLYANGVQVAFPCTAQGGTLTFFAVNEEDWRNRALAFLTHPGRFFSPDDFPRLTEVAPEALDAIIVPGAAFDRDGRRLGMGAGCYDRFLPQVRTDCLVAGAAFDEQVVLKVPTDAHDVALSAIVTPTRTLVPDPSFDAVAYINEPRWMKVRPGLERVTEVLNRLGRPQDGLRFVHVAGTNGKGSTCAYLERTLREAGYRTGLFTSPYILRFEERIRVDGSDMADDDLRAATLAVREAAEAMVADGWEHPTEFELMCAVALVHFAAARCDIVVMEVGLGGALDATNVIDCPEACVIARIGLDHTDLLGDTLAAIAREKAGIIKPGAAVVSWPHDAEALAVVRRVADENGCCVRMPDFAQLDVEQLDGLARRRFAYRGSRYETTLLGTYQPCNAALDIEAVNALRERGWAISDDALHRGIALASWPGRFEVAGDDPLFIIDGGHNPQGARVLADSLRDLGSETRPVFLMGVLADKDYHAMVCEVAPLAAAFVCFTPPNPRALAADDLAAAVREELAKHAANDSEAASPRQSATAKSEPVGSDTVSACGARTCPADNPAAATPVESLADVGDAVKRAVELARDLGTHGMVCAFGSLYSIAAVKQAAGFADDEEAKR